MKKILRLIVCMGLVLAGINLCATVRAQIPQAGKTPPKKSFSSKPTDNKQTSPVIAVSDSDVADAIVGDALSGLFEQADAHYDHGEWNHTLNLYKIVEQGDPHNVETYSNSALLLWSTDRNDEAINQLKAGVAANPDSSYMYDELGTHYWIRLKDAVSAVPWYEKAIKYKCGWTTYHNLAFCYQKLNRWDKAVETWKQATKYGEDKRAPALLKQAEAHLK